jgi:hypothetical protein
MGFVMFAKIKKRRCQILLGALFSFDAFSLNQNVRRDSDFLLNIARNRISIGNWRIPFSRFNLISHARARGRIPFL